jgi:hypothetical protein
MPSIIEDLEEKVMGRFDLARRRIREGSPLDEEIEAALADIHGYFRKVDEDVRIMINSCW